jgi:Flp pilus assembly protein TadB
MPLVIALVVAVAGIVVTLMAYIGARASAERRTEARFHELAAARAERLDFEFQRYRDELVTLASHIAATDWVDQAIFARLTNTHVELFRAQTLAWVAPSSDGEHYPVRFSGRCPATTRNRLTRR